MQQHSLADYPLHIEEVSKAFKAQQVLKQVSFALRTQEIFGLIGLNGIGKTTLIKIILDLLQPDTGAVHFFGVAHSLPASRQRIAYLPEKFQPSPLLKGKEFIALSLHYYHKPYCQQTVEMIAEQLGFEISALTKQISKYSKGMGQKLGLMAAFLSNAPLLILDEPMSGLDPRARIQLKKMLLAYREAGNTIFFSSHILSDIEEICDRIAVIDQGKLLYSGAPTDFRTRYENLPLEQAFLKALEQAC